MRNLMRGACALVMIFSPAVMLVAMVQAQDKVGDYNLVIGSNAGRTMSLGDCNILVGDGLDVPSPHASYYINVDGVTYQNTVRKQAWFRELVTRRSHEVADVMQPGGGIAMHRNIDHGIGLVLDGCSDGNTRSQARTLGKNSMVVDTPAAINRHTWVCADKNTKLTFKNLETDPELSSVSCE